MDENRKRTYGVARRSSQQQEKQEDEVEDAEEEEGCGVARVAVPEERESGCHGASTEKNSEILLKAAGSSLCAPPGGYCGRQGARGMQGHVNGPYLGQFNQSTAYRSRSYFVWKLGPTGTCANKVLKTAKGGPPAPPSATSSAPSPAAAPTTPGQSNACLSLHSLVARKKISTSSRPHPSARAPGRFFSTHVRESIAPAYTHTHVYPSTRRMAGVVFAYFRSLQKSFWHTFAPVRAHARIRVVQAGMRATGREGWRGDEVER
ncbi:hypothetical protein ALC60_08846 [Trachymyrmex zeteki]|uniref:Uncharacterized protein n=1 Tax=Mycetomoellerius zeteki TaxID=64791 RepID=A0A151WX36_9HYME|nr:hypothetical protein ALC60_08846 [Trachymyrmex zeteki]